MPFDHALAEHDDDEKPEVQGALKEFDCPDCAANNPLESVARDRDEIQCHYCGGSYQVMVRSDGRIKFKSL